MVLIFESMYFDLLVI